MSQRGGDRSLVARLDVEQGQCEPLSLFGKCARRGRQSFAFGERSLECLQPLARDARLFPRSLALCAHACVEDAPRPRKLCAEPFDQCFRAFLPQLQSFARAAQAIESGGRLLPAAGGVGELLFCAAALLEQGVQLLVGVLAREDCRRAPALPVFEPLAKAGEIELGHAGTKRRDLSAKLLCALGRGGLQRERPEPLLHLGLDVAGPLDLDRNARELELGAVLAALEAPEPGGLLEQGAAFLGLRAENLLDAALADDRVHPSAEAEIGEELDEVDAAHGRAVQEVLTFAAAVQPPRDRELGVRQRPFAFRVVEEQLDLAEVFGRAAAPSCEEDVVRLLRAELGGGQRAGRPDDRIGDVRLAGAVRTDDDGNARLETNLDRFRERLEAAQLDGA